MLLREPLASLITFFRTSLIDKNLSQQSTNVGFFITLLNPANKIEK